MLNKETSLDWESYFKREKKSFFQILLSLHRKIFISRSVRFYTDRYFKKKGVFIEAGAGTSESSSRIKQEERQLIALDFNFYVLASHNVLDRKIQGDIFSLPLKEKSVDGIWNLGVMEHFSDEDIVKILKEFHRIMKTDGMLLLFWPPFFAFFQIVLSGIAWMADKLFGKKTVFFPDEINLYQNKRKLLGFLQAADFDLVRQHFNIRDMFSYVVIAAAKKKKGSGL